MIKVLVNIHREAVISLRVFGPVSGNSAEINAVVDTGFDDYLTLPLDMIASLALVTIRLSTIQLADGSTAGTILFGSEVEWHGKRRAVEVQLAPGAPLLGMRLLEGSRLTIDIHADGPVLIEEK